MNMSTINNNWLLSDSQAKLIKLSNTYHTLTACGYSAPGALRLIANSFGLTATELQWLVQHTQSSVHVEGK